MSVQYESYFAGCKFRLLVGKIEQHHADCLVNAANSKMKHGSGVARALSDAAGPQMKQETQMKRKGLGGEVPVGSCIVTKPGNLMDRCKYIIHAVGPKCSVPEQDQNRIKLLGDAVKHALNHVRFLQCQTVAFPLISSGRFAMNPTEVAQAMVAAMKEWLETHPDKSITRIDLMDTQWSVGLANVRKEIEKQMPSEQSAKPRSRSPSPSTSKKQDAVADTRGTARSTGPKTPTLSSAKRKLDFTEDTRDTQSAQGKTPKSPTPNTVNKKLDFTRDTAQPRERKSPSPSSVNKKLDFTRDTDAECDRSDCSSVDMAIDMTEKTLQSFREQYSYMEQQIETSEGWMEQLEKEKEKLESDYSNARSPIAEKRRDKSPSPNKSKQEKQRIFELLGHDNPLPEKPPPPKTSASSKQEESKRFELMGHKSPLSKRSSPPSSPKQKTTAESPSGVQSPFREMKL